MPRSRSTKSIRSIFSPSMARGPATRWPAARRTPRRTRVETIALGIQRQAPAKRVTLFSRAPQTRPLGGIAVDVEPDDPKVQAVHLFSDRQGQVVVPALPRRPQVWLSLFSGRA